MASPVGDRSRQPARWAPEPAQPIRLRPSWGVVGLVIAGFLAVVVGVNVFVAAHRIIGWTVAASVVAILLTPLVNVLARALPRPLAFLSALALVAAVAIAIGYGVFGDLRAQADRIREEAPAAAQRIEQRDDGVGDLARDVRLTDRVDSFVDALDERVGTGGAAIRNAALSVPSYFVAGILSIFLMIYGERIVRAGIEQLRDGRRRMRMHRAVTRTVRHGRTYLLTAMGQAALVAATVWVGCHFLGVPAPVVLSLIAAVVALVPYLGIVLAWTPVLLLGLGFSPFLKVALVATLVVGMQVAESWWWRPRIDQRTLHVGPVVPVVVGVLGWEIYGVGGALYGGALAVLGLAFADAVATVTDEDEPIPTPVDEWTEDEAGEDADDGSDAGSGEAAPQPADP